MAAVQPPSSVHSQQHSVIQAAGPQLQQQLQNMHDNEGVPTGGADVTSSSEDAAKKRRDMMTRRPSYRKILNDLSGDAAMKMESYGDDSGSSTDPETATSSAVTSNSSTFPQSNHVSTSLVTHPASAEAPVSLQNLQAIQIAGAGQSQPQPTVVQLTANGQAYTIRGQLPQGVVLNSQSPLQQSPQQLAEDATRKREMRLLKNREAAKECRRKKKEYVKCLENRVAVLENQNKQLIEELKSLKDLYCNKQE